MANTVKVRRERLPDEKQFGTGDVSFDVPENEVARFTQSGYKADIAPTPPKPTPTDGEQSAGDIIADGGASRSDSEVDAVGASYKEGANRDIDPDAIREEERAKVKQQLTAIDDVYRDIVRRENIEGGDRLGQDRARQSRGGLQGSDFGASQTGKVREFNQEVLRGIDARKQADILVVLDKADNRAIDRADKELTMKRQDRDAYLKFLTDQETEAKADFAVFAESGISFDKLDPTTQAQLSEQTGFGANASQIFNTMASGNLLKKLETTSAVGGSILPEEQQALDAVYGLGFTANYYDTVEAVNNANSEKEKLDASMKVIDRLSKIGEDKTLIIAGVEYKGMKEIDPEKGLHITTAVDTQTGETIQLTTRLNEETGQMEIVGTLNLGINQKKPSSGDKTVASKGFKTIGEDGEVQYLYGDPKNPDEATKIDKDKYTELTQTASQADKEKEGEEESGETMEGKKLSIDRWLDDNQNISKIKEKIDVAQEEEYITAEQYKALIEYAKTKVKERDKGTYHLGEYEGKDI